MVAAFDQSRDCMLSKWVCVFIACFGLLSKWACLYICLLLWVSEGENPAHCFCCKLGLFVCLFVCFGFFCVVLAFLGLCLLEEAGLEFRDPAVSSWMLGLEARTKAMGHHAQLYNHLLFSLMYGKNLLSAAIVMILSAEICSVILWQLTWSNTLSSCLPRSAERAFRFFVDFLALSFWTLVQRLTWDSWSCGLSLQALGSEAWSTLLSCFAS